jgi:hypothetical protein
MFPTSNEVEWVNIRPFSNRAFSLSQCEKDNVYQKVGKQNFYQKAKRMKQEGLMRMF